MEKAGGRSFNKLAMPRLIKACAPQVTFWNVQQLMDVKRELMPALRRNKAKSATRDAYSAFAPGDAHKPGRTIQVSMRLDP